MSDNNPDSYGNYPPTQDSQGSQGYDSAQGSQGFAVPLGAAQPPDARAIPVLQPGLQALDDSSRPSTIAEGLVFEGNALLQGPCSVGGLVRGNLVQAPDTSIAVVVAESGEVVGDIRAFKISVMGKTSGTLDASGGSVAINDTASVSGHVRYSRLQVNGADLNATLERVPAPGQGGNKGNN